MHRGIIACIRVYSGKAKAEKGTIDYLLQHQCYNGKNEVKEVWKWLGEHERLSAEIVQQNISLGQLKHPRAISKTTELTCTNRLPEAKEQHWKAVPYNDETELANRFAVAAIVDGDDEVTADVFSREAATLIETAPELKKKLAECEKDYEYLKDVLSEIETKARGY